jgi:cytochrome P450
MDLGPKRIYVLNEAELVHKLVVKGGASIEKGRLFDKAAPVLGNGIAMSHGQFHAGQRRSMQPAFSRRELKLYFHSMTELADETIGSWAPDLPIPLYENLYALSLQIVAKCLFSTDLDREMINALRYALPIIHDRVALRTLAPFGALSKLPIKWNTEFESAIRLEHSVIQQIVEGGRDRANPTNDLLTMLLQAKDPVAGVPLSDEQIRDEVRIVLVAGAESTSLITAWLFDTLARHPEVEVGLRAELASGRNRVVDTRDLRTAPYLRQVITEVMRLYPPMWIDMRRSTEKLRLGGHEFPPGTEFAYSPYALHRESVVYRNPLLFDPHRWAEGEGLSHRNRHYLPFGLGAHRCIGEHFGWLEVAVLTSVILSHWTLRPIPGHEARENAGSMMRPGKLLMSPSVP